jgi:small subunit ribosomal protein S6
MKKYELTYIVSPEITNEESTALAKEIESFVQSKEGVILNQINPVAKTLAYPIKKHASGFMCVLEFQSEPELLTELEDKINKNTKIVRHIIAVKRPLKIRKERRAKQPVAPSLIKEEKTENIELQNTDSHKASIEKEKIELKDIEQKLEELLGE